MTAKETTELQKKLREQRKTKIIDLPEKPAVNFDALHEVGVSPEILDLLETPFAPHSMDMKRYAENRFSQTILERAIKEKMPVEIYTGNSIRAIAKLQSEGFTQVMKFTTRDGDFQKLMATNPKTNENKLVVMTLPGKSYRLQIEGTLLLYANESGERISPENVKVYEDELNLEQIYTDIFESYGLKPETVCIGEQAELIRLLEERGVEKTETISNPYLNGLVYTYRDAQNQTHTILSVNISPHLYGDNLTSFTKVAAQLGVTNIMFTGTAGALDKSLRIGDLVIPENAVYANPGAGKEPLALKNAAGALLPRLQGDNLRTVPMHGTVHSPVLETMPVVEQLRDQGIQTVECEIANIATGIADSGQPVEFFYHLTISDIPGTEHTNASKIVGELDPVYKDRPVVDKNNVTAQILGERLGLAKIAPRENKEGAVKGEKAGKEALEFAVEYEGGPAVVTLNFTEPDVSDLANFFSVKKMVNRMMQKVLGQGTATVETMDGVEQLLDRIRKDYSLSVKIELKKQAGSP